MQKNLQIRIIIYLSNNNLYVILKSQTQTRKVTMKDNFFEFYNVYSKLYNKALMYDINVNENNRKKLDEANKAKASQRLVVRDIGIKTLEGMQKVKKEKQKFSQDYQMEILAYDAFMENFFAVLPAKFEAKLRSMGHNVTLKKGARLSYPDLDRMIKSYMVNIKSSTKPYVIAHMMKKLMDTNGYYFSAEEAYKSIDYLRAFESSCQEFYAEMLNYVSVDYIKPSLNNYDRTPKSGVDTNSILVG